MSYNLPFLSFAFNVLDSIYTICYTYITMYKIDTVSVLGDGGWGTTLAILLAKKGLKVRLWSAFAGYADTLKTTHNNEKFLPGIVIPDEIEITSDMHVATDRAAAIVIAIPSQFLRSVISRLKGMHLGAKVIISVVKGIENETFKRSSEIIKDEIGDLDIAVLSGPTIACEIAGGLPATSVVASVSKDVAKQAQELFMSDRFRVYTSTDIIGVELGGALKNIIAIAAGISDGLKLGTNAKAALFTRGLVEMKRLGAALGAEQETFNGLSGIGDLVTTCISLYSRNRTVGEEITRGKKLSDLIENMDMVAEGIETTRSVYGLSKKIGIEMPITEQVYQVLFKDKNPHTAVSDLMLRDKKPE